MAVMQFHTAAGPCQRILCKRPPLGLPSRVRACTAPLRLSVVTYNRCMADFEVKLPVHKRVIVANCLNPKSVFTRVYLVLLPSDST